MPERGDIALPFDGRYMAFNRDKLATAVLVMMDVSSDYTEGLKQGAERLNHEFGFDRNDALLYPVGALICMDRGIEP